MKRFLIFIVSFVLFIYILTPHVHAASKVTLTPDVTTISENQSLTVQVVLAEPIIGPGPDQPFFHLNLTSSDPSRVTISPNPLDYESNEWMQIKTFTITVLNDNIYNSNNNITISFIVDSDSEYYDNFSGSFVLSIVDLSPASVTTGASLVSQKGSTLSDTGQDILLIQYISVITFFVLIYKLRKLHKSHQ